MNLKDKSSTLRLLLTTQLEMLASFQRQLCPVLALITFQTQHNLLCCLGLHNISPLVSPMSKYLLVEHGFGLTTVTALFPVVTSFSLIYQRCSWVVSGIGDAWKADT